MDSLEILTEKLTKIKTWLGPGSINIFGLPMSGKDTVGVRLAEDIGARFLSSGIIIRAAEQSRGEDMTSSGQLIPTNVFYDLVLPYFELPELKGEALILSSIGRWEGEEGQVMSVAAGAGHPIKAAVLLNISEADVRERWEDAKIWGDRGDRSDDVSPEVFETRIKEFREKTLPVLSHYRDLGLLVEIEADTTRDRVYQNLVDGLLKFANL